jgi:hypothetical protein
VRTADGKGDLFVEVRVEIPKLGEEKRAGLEKWAKEAGLRKEEDEGGSG